MDKYLFSYANASDPPLKRGVIRLVETATGQPRLKKMYLDNQRHPRPNENFFQAAVRKLAIDVRYDTEALAGIPRTGPVVVVANHPYGVLDGIVISWLVSKVRTRLRRPDQRSVDARPRSQRLHPAGRFQRDRGGAEDQSRLARRRARAARKGGAVVVFPAGAVSTAPDKLGLKPAVDWRWQPFVSQLIQRSKATVVPIWFSGQNSRLFQIASHVSSTLRLSLIFHEVRSRIGTALPVVIGAPIPYADLAAIKDRQALADHLRDASTRCPGRRRHRKKLNPAQRLLRPVKAALKAQRAA